MRDGTGRRARRRRVLACLGKQRQTGGLYEVSFLDP